MVCVFSVLGKCEAKKRTRKSHNILFRSGLGAVEEGNEEGVGHNEGPVEDHKYFSKSIKILKNPTDRPIFFAGYPPAFS